jgi:uncharacterized protein (PEP-CTERM system associated)
MPEAGARRVARPGRMLAGLACAVACSGAAAQAAWGDPPSRPEPQAAPAVAPQAPAATRSGNPQPAAEAATGQRSWTIDASLRTAVTTTTNSGVSERRSVGRDVIVETTPRVEVRHAGRGLTLDGSVEWLGLSYLQGSQTNRWLPTASLRARAETVENWLWLEALAAAYQTSADPFAIRGDVGAALNTVDTRQLRLSPVLQRSLSPTLTLTARAGVEGTQRRGQAAANDPRRDQRRRDALFRLESLPRPFGWTLEASDDETRFVNEARPVLRLSEARAVASWQLDPSLVVGAVAGHGRTRFPLASRSESFGGGRLQWNPQERTGLRLSVERRFFGGAYDLELSHRNPFFAAYLGVQRLPSAQPASLLLPPGADVAGLLDAIFTTRFPNPIERAAVVRGVLDGLGRPSGLSQPVEVFAQEAQLQRRANLALVWQGRRSTATLRWINLDTRQLAGGESPFVPTAGFGTDTRQRLVSFDLTHRLAADLSVEFSLARGRIEGLGVIDGSATEERIARLALTWAVNPSLDLSAGLRRQLASSTVQPSATEWALILGALYRH